jgi:hypothetical protein
VTPRFYVAELRGYLGTANGGSAPPGIGCYVVDSLYKRDVVAIYRSEDFGGNTNREMRHARARDLAAAKAAELNAWDAAA